MSVKPHHIIAVLTVTSLLLSTSFCGKNTYQKAKAKTESLNKNSHFHRVHQDGDTLTVEIHRYKEHPEGEEIISKEVRKGGKLVELYTKGRMNLPWKRVPIGCLKRMKGMKSQKRTEKCANGWEIGKIIARTITYLALQQGHSDTENENGGINSSERNSKSNGFDMEEIAENIRKIVKKTAGCVKQGLSLSGVSTKEVCIQRAMVKESNLLIEEILSNAADNGFKCSYEALKLGKCRLAKNKEELERGISLIRSLKSY